MKKILVFYLIFLSLILCSCKYRELNNTLLIDSIVIDKEDDLYKVYFNTYYDHDYKVYDISIKDIDSMFYSINFKVNKDIYLTHLNLLGFTNNIDNDDFISIYKSLISNNNLSNFNIIMINNFNNNFFKNNSSDISNIINNTYIKPCSYRDLRFNYNNLDISYIPVIDNKDLSLIGIHSVFSEYKFLDLDDSLFLNILMNNVSSFRYLNKDYKVRIKYIYSNNKMIIKIYSSNDIKLLVERLNLFINSNNINYFKNKYIKYYKDLNNDLDIIIKEVRI